MPAPLQSPAARKILVRGVNWLGDAVMSMPALERLREACPRDHIALLTRDSTAGLWENHPAVNQVIPFAKAESIFSLARRLRAEHFDVALILPNSHRSALESFLARIPERIGHARPSRNLLLTRAIPPRPEAVLIRPRSDSEIKSALGGARPAPPPEQSHHIYDYLHLAQALGAKPVPSAPRIPLTPDELARAEDLLVPHALTSGWLALNAGAEYGPAKRWPAERFVETALEVHRQTGCGWVLLGGPGDAPLAARLERSIRKQSAAPLVNLAGKTTLRELCAVCRLCRVVLTNDSGPMHIAAAAGAPVVALFGSTSPELTGPGAPGTQQHTLLKAEVPCSPCFRRECPIDFRCMHNLKVPPVVAALLRHL